MPYGTRILFVPFTDAHSGHFMDKCRDWKKTYEKLHGTNKHKIEIVAYNGQKQNVMAWACGYDDQIYTRGHGGPGLSYVTSDNGPNPEILQHSELCDRLIQTGLRKHFCGTLKFYH